MRYDLIIAGVGGQGILSIAAVIGRAALARGWHLKQSEVHGMAQRGGAVQAHMRLADGPIYSDLIPLGRANLILAMEPLEALRYLAWLAPDGWVVTNSAPVENVANYPAPDRLREEIRALPRRVLFDAAAVAREQCLARAVNMAMLGAVSPFIAIAAEGFETAIAAQFARKGADVVAGNLAVFRAARALAEQQRTERQAR